MRRRCDLDTIGVRYLDQIPDIEDLADGLRVVAHVGLTTDRLIKASEDEPALARLLDLNVLGPPGTSLLVRAGKLPDVLSEVLPRLGDGRTASAADVLLSVSPEHRGQSWKQRRHRAAYIWNPDYGQVRYFDRPLKEIIQNFAGELAFYEKERSPRRADKNKAGRRPMSNSFSGISMSKTKYERVTRAGKTQVRYALRANYQGRNLTKFISEAEWNALSQRFYDIETRQSVEAIPVV